MFPENKLEIKNIKRTLTKEQVYNVCSSLSVPSGANFSVPGAGKTTTTLTIWSHLLENKKVNKLLVICPKSAFEAWLETEPKETFKIAPKTQLFEKYIIRSDIKILVNDKTPCVVAQINSINKIIIKDEELVHMHGDVDSFFSHLYEIVNWIKPICVLSVYPYVCEINLYMVGKVVGKVIKHIIEKNIWYFIFYRVNNYN